MGETHLDFHTVFIRYIVHLYTNDEFSTRNPFEASSQIVCRKSKMDTEPGILKLCVYALLMNENGWYTCVWDQRSLEEREK